MNDSNMEQLTACTNRTKSIEAVQATKSGHPGVSLDPATPVARRKRWRFTRLIALMSLGAIPVIVYLLRHAPADMLEGLGVALCAIACGAFLDWCLIHLLAEEDKLQEEQLNANPAIVSRPEPNPAGRQTNLTAPPEAGENVK